MKKNIVKSLCLPQILLNLAVEVRHFEYMLMIFLKNYPKKKYRSKPISEIEYPFSNRSENSPIKNLSKTFLRPMDLYSVLLSVEPFI